MTAEITPAPRRHTPIALRFAIAFVVGIALVVVVGGVGLFAYGQQYTGRILPGVTVGETDLSGMSPEAAAAAINAAYAGLGSGRVVLVGPEGETAFGFDQLGRRPDTDAIVRAALAVGRAGQPVADLIGAPRTALNGAVVPPAVTLDEASLEEAVAAAAAAIDREVVNATLAVDEDGSYATTGSVDGRSVDQASLAASLGAALASLDAPAEIRLDVPFTTTPPTLSTEDVEAATAAADRMSADLVLTRGEDSWTIPSKKLRPLISFQATPDGKMVPVVDEAGIAPLVKPIAKDVNQEARNAGFKLQGDRVVVGAKSREGRRMDVDATQALVLDALKARQAGQADTPLEPVIAVTEPSVTTEEAKAIAPKMQALPKARWTTWFKIYERNGFGANIWIPAKLINGYVVGPGETFDFWKAVGPVTRSKGYKDGGAIINGRTEPQGALAGGICSCSTTLFNAALRGGYEMGARRNHYYYIDRYPVGLDATVFKSGGGSTQTMSFTNDTEYPVLIRGINTRKGGTGYVTFQLYSVPTGRKVVIGAPVIKNKRKATDTTQVTSSLRPGQTERVEFPVDGFDVWRTVTVYEDGKVLRKKTYYSHYATITGILLKGKGTPAPPSPAPSPTASTTP